MSNHLQKLLLFTLGHLSRISTRILWGIYRPIYYIESDVILKWNCYYNIIWLYINPTRSSIRYDHLRIDNTRNEKKTIRIAIFIRTSTNIIVYDPINTRLMTTSTCTLSTSTCTLSALLEMSSIIIMFLLIKHLFRFLLSLIQKTSLLNFYSLHR